MATPWTFLSGVQQGRIIPANAAAVVGSYVYVLGSDAPGVVVKLAIGDYVEVTQTVTVTSVDLIQGSATIRPPAAIPAGLYWHLSLRVDGVEVTGRSITAADVSRDLDELAAPVGHLTGDVTVAFRLELRGVAATQRVELPGVYLDNVSLLTVTDRPVLINRTPEPGESGVVVNETIELEFADVGGVGVDLSGVTVSVDGVDAFLAGVFQSGFTGPDSGYSVDPGSNSLLVTIDMNAPFLGNASKSVRAQGAITGASLLNIDETWSFTTEDLSGPVISQALAIELDRIRVTFDDNVLAVSSAGAADALNPANWLLNLATGASQTRTPAVRASVSSVEFVGSTQVDLITDVTLTARATYDLQAVNVADLNGNEALAPGSQATFLGFQPGIPPGRDVDQWKRLPIRNRIEDDGTLAGWAACVTEVLEDMLYALDRFGEVIDPDTAPEPIVDLMLVDLGNPFDFDLSLVDKRRLLRVLVDMYAEKGTDAGIINVIRFFLGLEVTINIPWHTGIALGSSTLGGSFILTTSSIKSRLTFEIVVATTVTSEQTARMLRIASYMRHGVTHTVVLAPSAPAVPAHWALGASALGLQTINH